VCRIEPEGCRKRTYKRCATHSITTYLRECPLETSGLHLTCMHGHNLERISQQPAQEHASLLNSELDGQGKGLLCFASSCTGDIDIECLSDGPGEELGLLQPQGLGAHPFSVHCAGMCCTRMRFLGLACASRFPASFPPPSFVSPLRLFVTHRFLGLWFVLSHH
jgi:hypothetical protein